MISVVIIDDEQAACEVLQMELEKNCPDVKILQIANGAKEGLLAIKHHKPDLVFLDIDMPWMNGLELIELLPDDDMDIIFVTAHDEYAIQAIKTSALDFLTKPVDGKILKKAVNNLYAKKDKREKINQYQFLVKQVEALKNNKIKQIILPTQEGISFVCIEDIIYCKADDTYTSVYLKNGKRLLASKMLKDIDELLLNQQFYRCHKSYLVNLKKIVSYSKTDGGFLMLGKDINIPLSRSKKNEFISLMNKMYGS